jgi:hypothetical protein
MPPAKPPQQPQGLYSSIVARLLKFKVLLNLLISDLLLFIFAILLFLAILSATFAALWYQQWFPTVSTYLQSIGPSSTSTMFTAPGTLGTSTPQ